MKPTHFTNSVNVVICNYKYLICGCSDSNIYIYELSNGKIINALIGHSDSISALCLTENEFGIISGSDDTTIKIWDISFGGLIMTMTDHSSKIISVGIIPNKPHAISCSVSNTFLIWNIIDGQIISFFFNEYNLYSSLTCCFNFKNIYLASGYDTGIINIWFLKDAPHIVKTINETMPITNITSSPKGLQIAYSIDNIVHIYNTTPSFLINTLNDHMAPITCIVYNHKGTIIATGSKDNTIKLWDTSTYKLITTFLHKINNIKTLTFYPDDTHLISGSYGEIMTTIKMP